LINKKSKGGTILIIAFLILAALIVFAASPTIDSLVLNTTNIGLNDTNQNLTAYVNASDTEDGDQDTGNLTFNSSFLNGTQLFNVSVDEDAKQLIPPGVKILTNEVIYKLIEDLNDFRVQKKNEIEKKRLMTLATIGKLEILHQYVFRNSNPAIFGVKVLGGKIRSGLPLIDETGEEVARIKNLQSENKSISEATEGMEVAMSLPGVNFERQLKETKFLYANINESQFKTFKKNKDILSQSEMRILQEIAEIKKRKNYLALG